MRIIVWGINYAPEVTGIGPHNTALCEFLTTQGHEVEMITSFAYSPAWEKLPEDDWKFYRTDLLNGIPVHRCWHHVPKRRTIFSRMLHELTFVKSSFLRCLALKRADLMVVVSPPLLLGPAAWLIGLIKRVPFVFHVQDLQPDGAFGFGLLKSSPLTRSLYWIESFTYRKAVRVSGNSKGMLRAIFKKGVRKEKRVFFPNGILLSNSENRSNGNLFRTVHGFYRDDFIVLYSGNIGINKGLETVLEAARFIQNSHIKIILCGAGSNLEWLQQRVKQYALQNIIFLPLQSEGDYQEMLSTTDLCLVPQQKGAGPSFFPRKLLNALVCGKPVLTVAEEYSELLRLLEEGMFGENVLPDRPEALAARLEALARDPVSLGEYGEAGRQFVAQFEQGTVLAQFTRELEKLVPGTNPVVPPVS